MLRAKREKNKFPSPHVCGKPVECTSGTITGGNGASIGGVGDRLLHGSSAAQLGGVSDVGTVGTPRRAVGVGGGVWSRADADTLAAEYEKSRKCVKGKGSDPF